MIFSDYKMFEKNFRYQTHWLIFAKMNIVLATVAYNIFTKWKSSIKNMCSLIHVYTIIKTLKAGSRDLKTFFFKYSYLHIESLSKKQN